MSHRSYLLTFGLCLLVVAGIAGMNALYLRQAGEFLSIAEIVAKQQADPGFCIYGTALHDDTFSYKQETYAVRQPQVVAVGSSLMMELRERFFRGSFYTMGGTMDSIVNGTHAITLLTQEHRPTVLLLGIDWWWFRAGVDPYRRSRPPLEINRFTPEKIIRPLQWMWSGKLSLSEYLTTATGTQEESACAIGVQSKELRRGFAPDGSYYYTSLITGQVPAEPGFAPELTAIRDATGRFAAGSTLNEDSVRDFVALIQGLQKQGVHTMLFFQPVAPIVWAEMQRHPEQFAYIGALQRSLSEAGIAYENFLDATALGSPDCEFIDGIHGGDVTYARVLRRLYDRETDPTIRSLFAIDTIDATIADNAGLAMEKDPRVTTRPETDFLGLGCEKR